MSDQKYYHLQFYTTPKSKMDIGVVKIEQEIEGLRKKYAGKTRQEIAKVIELDISHPLKILDELESVLQEITNSKTISQFEKDWRIKVLKKTIEDSSAFINNALYGADAILGN